MTGEGSKTGCSSFPPTHRLRRRRDFTRLEQQGKRIYSSAFLIVIAPAEGDCIRLGIAVTRKLDKRAVVRNRIKRRVREIFRRHRGELRAPFDMLVIARRAALTSTLSEMERQMMGALRHNGYLG